ncbi:M81 family metallopeptidase [Endozoicomonas arenosclerae]|uniref:M81 family metallopeptidase n=1 Tax=Endozoicomonas arenosclerae TaxID=1633495 RepID=UPI00078248F7|nr:M81 family metallopeptidase [Endozoicomonas arenosclerae]
MRIFTGGIITETNTFSPVPTGYDDFISSRSASKQDDLPNECLIESYLQKIAEQHQWHLIPSFIAVAEPDGTTTRQAYEQLREELLQSLKQALPVDMVLLPLHGAMVAEGYDDCEGDIVTRVREIVGPDIVIGVELDLHCHLSRNLVDQSSVITIYREYPHTDILERAGDLLMLCADAVLAKTKPVMALYDCRIINLYPTANEPMRSLVEHFKTVSEQPGIITAEMAHGFPYGDVADCGTRILVIADNDPALASETAKQLAEIVFEQRHELLIKPLSMESAFAEAQQQPATGKPIVIADMSDNAGGGAPSDSTYVLEYMLNKQVSNAAVGMIFDPQVAAIAMKAGIGSHLKVRLGGKTCHDSGQPLDLDVEVIECIPGMIQRFPQSGDEAIPVPCGDSVCLKCQGVYIIVNSTRTQVFHPEVFTKFGLSLAALNIVVVKSIFHFHAGFAPVAESILLMSPPGALNMNFTEIPYTQPDLNKFPWQDTPALPYPSPL